MVTWLIISFVCRPNVDQGLGLIKFLTKLIFILLNYELLICMVYIRVSGMVTKQSLILKSLWKFIFPSPAFSLHQNPF